MASVFSDYTKCYQLSKTLRFSLIPQGKTLENIEKNGIITEDDERTEKYKKVKPVLDKYHRDFIEKAMGEFSGDWTELYRLLAENQKLRRSAAAEEEEGEEQKKSPLEGEQEKMRKSISVYLKKHHDYKSLEPKTIIEKAVKNQGLPEDVTEEDAENLKSFNKFSTYFTGYKENRENIYGEEKSVSVAFRTVNDNFTKFAADCRLFATLFEEDVDRYEKELEPLLGGYGLREVFTPEFYNNVLNQQGIDFFNTLLGGVSESETVKLKGLNELCNLDFQQRGDKRIKFIPLFGQILGGREKLSFVPVRFESDEQLIESVKEYAEYLGSETEKNAQSFVDFLKVGNFDTENVFVDKKQLSAFSQLIFEGDWSRLGHALADSGIKGKSIYTLAEIFSVCEEEKAAEKFCAVLEEKLCELPRLRGEAEKSFSENRVVSYDCVKEYLDKVQECEKLLKIFAAGEDSEGDSEFYALFDALYIPFRENIPIYNRVRNYAARKPYSTEKFKLNFRSPTLADGWDQNKEYSNNAMIFLKDGYYYLGILNAAKKRRIPEHSEETGDCYKKMVYKLLPGPNKMLPKVFFSKKGLETFGVSEYILEGYKEGKHKKGENFDLDFCHDLIDYFKEKIAEHEDWSKFGFKFSDTSTYKDISGFYGELSKQNYKVTFSYVKSEDIEEAVNNGSLYLFKIYNKDFSEHATGKPNLHTLYWKAVFSDENLKNPIFKLNGQAELFYRYASIENPFVHKKGSVLINKTDVNGSSVSEDIYLAAVHDAENAMSLDELRAKYPLLKFRAAPHDIIKDKRYSQNVFSFHVPIDLNYGIDDKFRPFNASVLHRLIGNKDVNIIGIDRGERNLIYVSCINQKGEILEQRSFNVVGSTDYHKKLDELEKQRDAARKNWKSIDRIKDMKEGYLSGVIHEITDMMLRYNAVIVMEDLNFGFKRGRYHIEKQVYQKFEKMLIDKLNYLADKSKAPYEEGGVCCGYQLADKFVSFQRLGKQSGFIFYVPAANTSKIDPKTGFVNLFTSEQLRYSSVEKAKSFFKSFESIRYDSERKYFSFTFRYSDFNLKRTDFTDRWTVCTYGDRICYTKKDGYHSVEKVNVTERMYSLLKENGVDPEAGELIEKITALNTKEFFSTFLWLFKTVLQLRYESPQEDFILSPVERDGRFFDSRTAADNEPSDGDANGAYHIALQGLRLITERIELKGSKAVIKKDESGKQLYNWLRFAQDKPYLS